MIRHARALCAALPVIALTVAMIEPPFRTSLMPLIGPSLLLASSPPTTRLAAVPVPAVAVRTKEEGRQAVGAKTSPLHQYRFVRRHASSRRAYWTSAPVRVSLNLSVRSHLLEGDDIRPPPLARLGAFLLPPIPSTIQRPDDRTDDCAFGADDVASGLTLRKLRFQMIDDTPSHALCKLADRTLRTAASERFAVHYGALITPPPARKDQRR
ncbi:MAG: hypothetical protein K2X03_11155 [Bryobacteraceae bacterium]|nr:hypothetical protein [Bryobacteraceae bacterium]